MRKYLFFGENDSAQKLVFQSSYCDGKVNNGGASTDFWGVSWVRKLSGHVKPETAHHIHFFVANFHLEKENITIKNI